MQSAHQCKPAHSQAHPELILWAFGEIIGFPNSPPSQLQLPTIVSVLRLVDPTLNHLPSLSQNCLRFPKQKVLISILLLIQRAYLGYFCSSEFTILAFTHLDQSWPQISLFELIWLVVNQSQLNKLISSFWAYSAFPEKVISQKFLIFVSLIVFQNKNPKIIIFLI